MSRFVMLKTKRFHAGAAIFAAVLLLCATMALGGEVFQNAAGQAQAAAEPWEDAPEQPQTAQPVGQAATPQTGSANWTGQAPRPPAVAQPEPTAPAAPPPATAHPEPAAPQPAGAFSEPASRKAEREKRRNARLSFTRGIDLFNAGDYEQAFQMFLDFLAVFPEDPQGQQYLKLTQDMISGQKEGILRVDSHPQASVYVDGRLAGETPLTLTAVPAGPHQVEARAGGVSQISTVIVRGRTTTSVEFDLNRRIEPPPPGWHRHSRLGFLVQPPPGWRVQEDARGGKTALRITAPDGNAMLQVDIMQAPGEEPDVEGYARKWEETFMASGTSVQERLDWRWVELGGRRFLLADYAGGDIWVRMYFLGLPGQIYFFGGIAKPDRKEACFADLERLVLSFQPR